MARRNTRVVSSLIAATLALGALTLTVVAYRATTIRGQIVLLCTAARRTDETNAVPAMRRMFYESVACSELAAIMPWPLRRPRCLLRSETDELLGGREVYGGDGWRRAAAAAGVAGGCPELDRVLRPESYCPEVRMTCVHTGTQPWCLRRALGGVVRDPALEELAHRSGGDS